MPATTAAEDRHLEHRDRTRQRQIVWAISGLAAVVAALTSGAEPTGHQIPDLLWTAAFAALVTGASSRSRRYGWLWLAGVTVAASVGSWWVLTGVIALVGALIGVSASWRSRILGAGIGAMAVLALLNQPTYRFHGFSAIVVVIAVAPVLWSGYERSSRPTQANVRRVLLVGCVVITVVACAAAGAALMARSRLSAAVGDARSGLDALRDGKSTRASDDLARASDRFDAVASQMNAHWLAPASFIPLVSQHVSAISTAAEHGARVTLDASDAAATAPYGDLKASAGSIDLATVVAMQEPAARAAQSLREAEAALEAMDTSWLLPPATKALDDFSEQVAAALPEAEIAELALDQAPALLGGDGPRTYLVLFTSPSEARNLGGFAGSYGILTAQDGTVDFTVSGTATAIARESSVDPDTVSLTDEDEFSARYAGYFVTEKMQNLTASPDMATTARVAGSIYEQYQGAPIDGVVVVDPYGLAALLELTGPVDAGLGEPLTAENAAQYLLIDQYVEFEGETEDRRDALEAVGKATFDALTDRDLPGPRQLGKVLAPVVHGKHLMFVPLDAPGQSLIERTGADGRFAPDLTGDFLSVRNANMNANKIDYFLRRSVAYDASYDPTSGRVDATATVTLHNDAPSEGFPDYVIGGQVDGSGPGTSAMLVTVYSPLLAASATLDGQTVGIQHQRELGTNAFTFAVTIAPGSSATLVVELDGSLTPARSYRLAYLTQPAVRNDQLDVHISSASDDWVARRGIGLDVADGAATSSTEPAGDTDFTVFFRQP